MAQVSQDTDRYGIVSISLVTLNLGGQDGSSCNPKWKYTWRPPGRLHSRLPRDLKIEFDCYHLPDGQRAFVPVGGGHAYVDWAFRPGLEILRDVKGMSNEQHHSYLAMQLLFKRVRQMREHLDRKFDAARDLYIRPRGRPAADDFSVVPEDVGLDREGHGSPWSNTELTSRGQEAAKFLGIANPTRAQAVHYGLEAAARLRPLFPLASDIPALFRDALFDTSAQGAGRPDTALIELVNERLVAAVHHRHLGDPNSAFDAWFMPGKGNLPKLLAGTKTTPGGKLAIAAVNRVLLDQGWQAYQYMADCLRAVGVYFVQALADQLTAEEKTRFEQMYLPQACFGNLPLVLLLERAPLLPTIIPQLWENPSDREIIGVLHRLLHWYSRMNEKRRPADRLSKRTAPTREVDLDSNRTAADSQVRSPQIAQSRHSDEQLQELFGIVFERRRIECPHCQRQSILRGGLERVIEPGEPLHLTAWCPDHGQVADCVVPWSEFENARALVMGE